MPKTLKGTNSASNMFENFVDADEAGKFLSLTRRRVLDLARAGHLPGHPIGNGAKRVWRFRLSEIAAAIATPKKSGCPTNTEQFRRNEMMKMPKILVAEDDPRLAHCYVILLSQWNCETVVEHTGTEAIRRAAAFRPDIALLGVVMPEMGGVEAGIKLLEICAGTKIVLVTESVPPETLEQLEAQGYHFQTLPAPFSREELHASVFGPQSEVLR